MIAPQRPRRALLLAGALLATLVLAACSSGDDAGAAGTDDSDPTGSGTDSATTEATSAVGAGTPVTVTGPVTGGTGTPMNAALQDLAAEGYVEEEYFISGDAQAYTSAEPLGADGVWTVEPGETAPYTTRILVRRPADAADFSGTVTVEWLNVSSGMDGDPDWGYLHQELLREGHAWVGVSAQAVGVNGFAAGSTGAIADQLGTGNGLRNRDKERYGDLEHPGDSFAFDIYSQAGRAVRGEGDVDPLGPLEPEQVIAAGESQSAIYLTTYVNAVHPLAGVYDGFLIHSRSGSAAPLSKAPQPEITAAEPPRTRTDLDEPVLIFQTETDVGPGLEYYPARQPDTDTIRLWEVAGTAHADSYLLEEVYGVGGNADTAAILNCDTPINSGPQHAVLKAGFHHLVGWVGGGDPPPAAPRLSVVPDSPPRILRDGRGNALGGIRTPAVDVPTATLTGEVNSGSGFCFLFGSTTPFDAPTLAAMYPSKEAYVSAVTQSAQDAVALGFLLQPEADAIVADAQASTAVAG